MANSANRWLVWLTACVEEINTPIMGQRQIVVNCLLTLDKVQKLTLTYTNELNNTAYEEVPEASLPCMNSTN